jgi:serine/threonine protein kinase
MTQLDHERVTTIFAEALRIPASQRGAFLDSTCCGEPYLRREIDELLGCADGASAAFEAAARQIVEPDPRRIGPYELLELIGEGGMAVVYKAQQHNPVQRIVAIKLIKLGMDTRQFVARFESERQALAMMDHPNVARVFDAGSTASGRPYFVMEHVPGEAILDWCDARKLGLRNRLALFIPVCEAVEHAHRKGIIHRDLKSSNVLVTQIDGHALPKVIDFGVAKVVSQPLTDHTKFTEHGQLIGTSEYMSPEQAEHGGRDIDTRSDIYSLGVLLYELIAGVPPVNSDVWRDGSIEQVQQNIREHEAPRPSTRLAALPEGEIERVALQRGMSVPALVRDLRNELEWIALKAIRKDREQRYRSASELADDIRNYLERRPLIAGPESNWYRARKTLRRHRVPVASAAAALLAMLLGTSLALWQALRASHARRAAEESNVSIRAVNDFLTEDLLWAAEPARALGREMTVREALDRAGHDVAARFKDRPRSEMAIRRALGGAYRELGHIDLGMSHAQAAMSIVRRLHLEREPDGLDTMGYMAVMLDAAGKLDEAEHLFREVLQTQREIFGPDHRQTIETMASLSAVLRQRGVLPEADALSRDALARARLHLGNDDELTLKTMQHRAALLVAEGNLADAEPLYRQALQRSHRLRGPDHPDTLAARSKLAALLWRRGLLHEAGSLLRELIPDNQRIFGDDHPHTASSIEQLALVLEQQGKSDEAEILMLDALERTRRALGNEHPHTLSTMINVAWLLERRGKTVEAEALLREALAGHRRVRGPEHAETLTAVNNLAFMLNRRGKVAEAESLLREVLETQRRVLGDAHAVTTASMSNLGGVLFEQKRYIEAEPLFREALESRRRQLGAGHPDTLGSLSNLGRTLRALARPLEAEPIFAELYRLTPSAQLPARQAALFVSHWGPCLVELGRYADAEPPLRHAYELLCATQQEHGEHMSRLLAALADVSDRAGRPIEAASWRTKLHELRVTTQPASAPH